MRLKNSDGAVIRGALPVLTGLLLKRMKERKLSEAAAICRFADERHMWALLAGFALESGDLNVMEECYKATGHFDKIAQIGLVRSRDNANTKAAEIKVLGNDQSAAETIVKRGELLDSLMVSNCCPSEIIRMSIYQK